MPLDFDLADLRVVSYEQKGLLAELVRNLEQLTAAIEGAPAPVVQVPTSNPTIQVEAPALDLTALTELFLQHQRHTARVLDDITKTIKEVPQPKTSDMKLMTGSSRTRLMGENGKPLPISVDESDGGLNVHVVGDYGELTEITPVAASISTVTLGLANPTRRGMTVYNESPGSNLFIKFGDGASTDSYTVMLAPGDYWESAPPRYGGLVTGVWATASGRAMVTEFF